MVRSRMEAAEEGGDAMRGVHAADRNSQSFFCVFSQILHMDILFDLHASWLLFSPTHITILLCRSCTPLGREEGNSNI
ncbi:hypothetical protein HKD37_14G039909 [Glycine soja]